MYEIATWAASMGTIGASLLLFHVLFGRWRRLRGERGDVGIQDLCREGLGHLGGVVAPRISQRWVSATAKRLEMAGSPGVWRAEELVGVEVCLTAITSISLLSWALGWLPGAFALPGLAAPLTPRLWLGRVAKERRRRIGLELPFVLDLLTLVVEAGHDLSTGMAKVVERMREGPLRSELGQALRELRMGRSRREALSSLAERSGSKELGRGVSTILQAEGMGAPLGSSLRILSEQLRSERFLLAEKRAAQAPVKMLLPLVVCIFPAVFLVLFGPILFAVMGG